MPSSHKKPHHSRDEVGYGKPPKQHQFAKGVSGNPSGRPKRDPLAIDLKASVKALLAREVTVTRGGRQENENILNVILQKTAERAMKGEFKAIVEIIKLARDFADAGPFDDPLSDEEQAILQHYDDVEREAGSQPLSGASEAESPTFTLTKGRGGRAIVSSKFYGIDEVSNIQQLVDDRYQAAPKNDQAAWVDLATEVQEAFNQLRRERTPDVRRIAFKEGFTAVLSKADGTVHMTSG